MNQQSRNLCRVVALWAILLAPVVSRADDDDGDDAPPKREGQTKRVIVLEESTVDQWIFQDNRARGGVQRSGTAAAGRAWIDSQLKAKLDELVAVCELNEAQRQQLALAARGDMKRFFDQVEKVRKKSRALNNDEKLLEEVRQECSSLHQQFSRGLFGDASLFAKTLRKTLTGEQQARYQAAVLDSRRAGYRAAIAASLARLANGVVLNREQREALQKLLLEETQPPLQFGPYDQQVVVLRLSQLPEAKLKGMLDKGQWKHLQPQLREASRTEDFLGRYGVIEELNSNSPVILRSVRTVVDGPATPVADAVKPE